MSIAEQLDVLMEQTAGRTSREMSRRGITLAKVTNIQDDKKLNRVKCLPIGSADAEETDWCYVMTPMGGKDCGMFFFPQVNDLVVLAYLDDDPHRPLVLGGYWNTQVKPPYTVENGKAEDYGIRTPRRIDLALHDEDKKQRVTLTMPSGTVLTVDDGGERVSVQDKDGANGLLLDLKRGEVTLKAKTKLTLCAGNTSLVLESGGNLTGKGSGTVSLEGANVQAKASGRMTLQGATAEVKSDATLDLNASGPATLKGAVVKIN
ncbi:MAG TPA: phage baseplate assembly protein V [Firmicutes bacterium]|nr:phage baseplate assembly protein V [Bacillota bacterium]